MAKKPLTNEQLIARMLEDMHTMEIAILRERLQCISEITRAAITEKPKDFDSPIFHHTQFLAVCDKIDKHLNTTN